MFERDPHYMHIVRGEMVGPFFKIGASASGSRFQAAAHDAGLLATAGEAGSGGRLRPARRGAPERPAEPRPAAGGGGRAGHVAVEAGAPEATEATEAPAVLGEERLQGPLLLRPVIELEAARHVDIARENGFILGAQKLLRLRGS